MKRRRVNWMARRLNRQWLHCLSFLTLVPFATGCNYLIFFGYLLGGPPSIDPQFDVETGNSMTAKDVTVAVVCYAPDEVKWNFDSIDHEIGKYVTYRLHEKRIKVVNPDRVRAWLDENGEWDEVAEVGRALGVTYVIYIDLQRFTLYEENSATLYRGRAEGMVRVIEMDETGNGEMIFSKDIMSAYPLQVPRDTSETTYSKFKRQYLSRLADEIGRLFYEYYNGADIPYAM